MESDRTLVEVDEVVSRWANTKLSWSRSSEPSLWRPGSNRLNDMSTQMNHAAAEIQGALGRHDPLWWESLAELANMVRTNIQSGL